MERINGYLCIDDCKKKLSNSKLRHYWIYIDGEEYYFKPITTVKKRYNELVGYYAAKILGIDACYYDLAVLNGKYGCISKSFRGYGLKLICGNELLCNFFCGFRAELLKMGLSEKDIKEIEKRFNCKSDYNDVEAINNLEVIWKILEIKYGNFFDIKNLIEQFIMMYIYTIIVADGDRHSLNWMLIESENGVRLAPLFDNEHILSDFFEFNNLAVNFNDFRAGFFDSLREFFCVYSSEYCELFIEMFDRLRKNFDSIFVSIEEQTGVEFPVKEKNELIEKFYSHCNKINDVIIEYREKRLKRVIVKSNGVNL